MTTKEAITYYMAYYGHAFPLRVYGTQHSYIELVDLGEYSWAVIEDEWTMRNPNETGRLVLFLVLDSGLDVVIGLNQE